MAAAHTRRPEAQSKETDCGLQRSEAGLRLCAWKSERQAELSPIPMVSVS